jgi:hypothetical protein
MANLRMNRLPAAAVVLACGISLAACAPDDAATGRAAGIGANQPVAGDLKGLGGAPENRHIIVQPGQSLGRIAETYHVSPKAIIAANHLTPPYKLQAGARLAIPVAAAAPTGGTMSTMSSATRSGSTSSHAAPPTVAAAAPSRAALKHAPPAVIPLDDASPKRGGSREAAAHPTPVASPSSLRPVASRQTQQEEIPLDDPPPANGHQSN